ncbi:DMT family transporter [Undibacterium terreum]|uniref:DMT transporter permease n=1 Tax=Undibacterium terreum TaxID=1224302 RepID=A0A916XJQ9_9BURK|nr:DMT family transporter [Undibacterium terreum]GGC77141.1 DMT transporter permease [Undibacterium terreum]
MDKAIRSVATASQMGVSGYLYGLAVALIWGAQPVVASFGYRAGLTTLDLTMLRFAASGLLMLPFFVKRGIWSACGVGWRHAAVFILLAGPLYNMVLVGGLQWAPATHSSLIYPAFTPLFTTLIARLLLKDQQRIPVAGLALLIAGVLTVKLGAILHPVAGVNPDAWRGDILFATAALMWSLYTVLMRRWNTEPIAVVAVVQVGGLLYLPFYFWFAGLAVFQLDTTAIAIQTLYMGIIVSVISVLMFNLAVRMLGPKAAMFTALMPVVGVGLAVLVLGEPLTWSLMLGTVLIVAGLFIALKKK